MIRPVFLTISFVLAQQSGLLGQAPLDLGPAPPIPAPPADIVPPPSPAMPSPPKPLTGDDDPFQQVPVGISASANNAAKGSTEFAAKHYVQAASIFADAVRKGEKLSDVQRDEWAYSRLYTVATQINRGGDSPAALAQLGKEVEDALRTGSDRLMPFGKKLLEELQRRGPTKTTATPAPPASESGWQVVESGSFRVLHKNAKTIAAEISQTAEAARVAMYERWAGPPAANWTPRCDVYLHATAEEYARACGKNAELTGHATVSLKGDRVQSRRIDLRLDDANVLDCALPHQTTLVILTEMFAEQPLPRWALTGMATLAESPESVANYRHSLPSMLQDRKLFAVGPFMEKAEFPTPENMAPFYVESVSLVSYLVELRGSKAFAAFLREAPRRGITKALQTHYEIKSPADLQDRWLKHSVAVEK